MSVPISRTLKQRREIEVSLTEASVSQYHLLLERDRAVLKVEFFDTDGRLAYMEGWDITGALLNQALNRPPQGGNSLEAIQESLNWIVNRVENTPNLKETMIKTGQLTLVRNPRILFDR